MTAPKISGTEYMQSPHVPGTLEGEVEALLFELLFEFLPVVQQHCTLKAFSILSPHLYEELFLYAYIFIHITVIHAHFNGILFVQCLAAIITVRSWSKLF